MLMHIFIWALYDCMRGTAGWERPQPKVPDYCMLRYHYGYGLAKYPPRAISRNFDAGRKCFIVFIV